MRILRVSIPADVADEFDELDLDELELCGHERFLRYSRDRKRLVGPPFAEDVYGREALDYLRDVAGDRVVVEDVTARYVFAETTAPGILDDRATVRVEGVGLKAGKRTVAIRCDRYESQIVRYAASGRSSKGS